MTYDEIGNPLSYRHYTLTWQNGRQLASLQIMQLKINYTYDVDGLRTSKSVPNIDLEHKYYYVGSRLQYEDRGNSNALWYFYDADGTPSGIRFRNNGGVVSDYYFVCNWRGDVIQIYNTAGELVSTYDYDAWGNVTAHETDKDTYGITNINPIRYRGYYYDTETGMYYLKSRYYDPAVKRFLNADGYVATGQSILGNNMFSYCDNNPVNREDSTGHFWKQLKAKVKNAWNGFKSWVNNTFGSGTTYYSQKKRANSSANYGLFKYENGTATTFSMSTGNMSKPVTKYIMVSSSTMGDQNLEMGISINFSNSDHLEIGVGLSTISISATYGSNQSTLTANTDSMSIEYTQTTTFEWDKGCSNSMYTTISVNIIDALLVYYGISTASDIAPYGIPVPAY